MKLRQIASAVVFGATMLVAGNSHASILTFNFGEFVTGYQQPGVADTFASLTVDSDSWTFRLEALDNVSLFGSDAFLGSIAFDGTLLPGLKNKDIKIENVSSSNPNAQVYFSNGGGPGGSFDFRNVFGPSKDERLLAGNWVEWTFVGLEGFTDLILHVQGIGSNGKESAWYGPGTPPAPIPIPGAAWLFGTALLGLGRLFHKSRK